MDTRVKPAYDGFWVSAFAGTTNCMAELPAKRAPPALPTHQFLFQSPAITSAKQ
jgi:hypothetical protein